MERWILTRASAKWRRRMSGNRKSAMICLRPCGLRHVKIVRCRVRGGYSKDRRCGRGYNVLVYRLSLIKVFEMSDPPAWLKRAEHGSLGEARARSFLLERFWVLERSIDKDGADYLIQRRLTNENFLDREPPRLGVVQVKFIQDGNTAIHIPAEYIRDKDGRPYSEFFLLVHTGNEDNQRQFLLTARQIVEDFGTDPGSEKYRIPGKA